jgi:hypothetical protein
MNLKKNKTMWTDEEFKKRYIEDAKSTLTQIEAALILATNNHLGCEIHIAGMSIGICNNKKIIPVLKHNKTEIEKYLRGEQNEYE